MTTRNNGDLVLDFLVGLGNDSEEIYHTLKEKGVKGHRDSSVKCPLAIAVRRELNLNVQVGTEDIIVYNGLINPWNITSTLMLPWELRVFVNKFDSGLYNDLVGDPYA